MTPAPLIVAHVTLAVLLLLPNILAPFVLRRDGPEPAEGRLARIVLALQGRASIWIGAGVALTGVALLAVIGLQALSQPWLLLAIGLYAVNLVVAFAIARPNVRRLFGLAGTADQETWARLARRQRYLAYGMAWLIGAIGLLMMTKPSL